ncbi:MAG: acyltransferase [Planctomycetaceae bacterium]|nr:acyltransferase [Planctomycetaceae bacterium]
MNRSFWIDLIRVVGALFVVAIHVSGRIAGGYAVEESAVSLGLAGLVSRCFCSACSKVAVSLFVMVSGALLLGRSDTLGEFYQKRFGKILLPFFAWNCIFIASLWIAGQSLKDGTPITLTSSIGAIFSGGVSGHFWFMYMLISLYLVAPFLSVFVRNAPKNMLTGFLALWFVAIVIFPLFHNVVKETLGIAEISKDFRFELVSLWVGFFVAGYVLKDVLISKRWALIALVAWCCFSIAGPVSGYLKNAYPDSSLSSLLVFTGKYVLPVAACQVTLTVIAFLALRSLGDLPSLASSRFGKMVIFTAPLTFGIYLSHHLLLTPVMKKLNLGGCNSWIIVSCAIPTLTIFFYFATAAGIYVLRRSRYLKFLVP